ncbi:MAG: anthranilate phosphoribosyltransferase [Odoribacter splanchnicus]
MKELLYKMFGHKSLSKEEAKQVLLNISDGRYNDSQLSAFMTVFLMRSITTEELAGFREAILERRVVVDLDCHDAIDIVGTGGWKKSFNIRLVLWWPEQLRVVKHGNYGASSVSGASNVLEQHGVKFTGHSGRLQQSLEESGVAYLHAPFFSPALKSVGPVRRALGVRTFFNMLGPLVNPVLPRYQLLGVYNLKLARLYNYMYQQSGVNYTIVHSLDGYDEVSLTSPFKALNNRGEGIYLPEEIGFGRVAEEELSGGNTVTEAAAIFDRVLANEATRGQEDCVIANAAFAIRTLRPGIALPDAIAEASEALESGRALRAFRKFVELNEK